MAKHTRQDIHSMLRYLCYSSIVDYASFENPSHHNLQSLRMLFGPDTDPNDSANIEDVIVQMYSD